MVALFGAACGEEKRPPDVDDADRITASVGRIVFHCRSVEQGFLASVDEEVLRRDVGALSEAAEDIDPDVSFRRRCATKSSWRLGCSTKTARRRTPTGFAKR